MSTTLVGERDALTRAVRKNLLQVVPLLAVA